MKNILGLLLVLLLCNVVQAKEVTVPSGTNIDIAVKRFTTSKHISSSYEINSVIKDDVVINGVKVFARMDSAIIEVGEFKRAKCFGRGGKITLVGAYATDMNGDVRKFILDKEIIGRNDRWFTRWIPFNKGHQAVIYPSQRFDITLAKDFVFDDSKKSPKIQQVNDLKNVSKKKSDKKSTQTNESTKSSKRSIKVQIDEY